MARTAAIPNDLLFDSASLESRPFSEGTDGVGAAAYSTDEGLVAFQSIQIADWSGQGIDSADRFDVYSNGDIVHIKSSPKRQLVLLQNWMPLVQAAAKNASGRR